MTTPADKMPDECHRCGYSPTRDLPWDEAEWMGRKGPERVACVPVAEAREMWEMKQRAVAPTWHVPKGAQVDMLPGNVVLVEHDKELDKLREALGVAKEALKNIINEDNSREHGIAQQALARIEEIEK